jgi:hypothetical protein
VKLTEGTQIIYVPMHANGDTGHPDCEAGFVTSVRGTNAFCRYWSKHTPGELRTKANSELTPIDCLVVQDTVPPEHINTALARIVPGTPQSMEEWELGEYWGAVHGTD